MTTTTTKQHTHYFVDFQAHNVQLRLMGTLLYLHVSTILLAALKKKKTVYIIDHLGAVRRSAHEDLLQSVCRFLYISAVGGATGK